MAYKILDISKWQPDVDYEKVAQAVDGVILRIGITYWGKQDMGKDSCFDKHYNGFKVAGVPVGVYYYSAADDVAVAEKEAKYCLELMRGKQFELPIYYDVENNERQGALTKEILTQIVDKFCSIIEGAGYFTGLYASTSWLKNKVDVEYLGNKYTIWKADYRAAYDKTIACGMHQYTSSAKIAGISGNVDMSNCYVDFEHIIKSEGLNGFKKDTSVKPSIVDIDGELIISAANGQPMSRGDVIQFANLLDSLSIGYESTAEGYIITEKVEYAVYAAVYSKAMEIGNIEVGAYVADTSVPGACRECDLYEAQIKELQERIRELQAELTAEHDKKLWYEEKLNDFKQIVGG